MNIVNIQGHDSIRKCNISEIYNTEHHKECTTEYTGFERGTQLRFQAVTDLTIWPRWARLKMQNLLKLLKHLTFCHFLLLKEFNIK